MQQNAEIDFKVLVWSSVALLVRFSNINFQRGVIPETITEWQVNCLYSWRQFVQKCANAYIHSRLDLPRFPTPNKVLSETDPFVLRAPKGTKLLNLNVRKIQSAT